MHEAFIHVGETALSDQRQRKAGETEVNPAGKGTCPEKGTEKWIPEMKGQ